MSQETLVVVIPAGQRPALRQRLSTGVFEFRTVPHALFSVKGEGVVATLYQSGKLVVQGSDPALFISRFADVEAPAPQTTEPSAGEGGIPDQESRTTIGSDECGKGDYFGPLVVAAVRLEPRSAQELRAAGVMDSKRVTDPRALQLGAWLRGEFPHSIQALDPGEYNPAWKERGLHTVLSDLHARAIRDLAVPGDRVVIDQFSKKDEIGPALQDLELDIEQFPRAESVLAVAAASIIARAEFLIRLRELGEQHDLLLPKGAGPPVDAAGAEFVRQNGFEVLSQVAKVHFKNTDKVRSQLEGSR